MSFRRLIKLNINKGIKKKFTKKEVIKKVSNVKIPYESKPVLKHKYSSFWRFHHGDEL